MNQLKVSLLEAKICLFERGWSQRRIARELPVDRETVRRYIGAAEPAISNPGSVGEAATEPAISTAGSAAGRVSLCREFLPQIIAARGARLADS